MIKPTLATRLRAARQHKGLTLRQLSMLSLVDAGWISRLETGERTNISLQAAIRLADALGVSLDYLAARHLRKVKTPMHPLPEETGIPA